MAQRGLLHSDQELFNGGSTDSIVRGYSNNPSSFSSDFVAAMIKMGDISPLTGSSGEIRKVCGSTNWLVAYVSFSDWVFSFLFLNQENNKILIFPEKMEDPFIVCFVLKCVFSH